MTTEQNYGKCSFLLTLAGFLLYLTDIGTDLWVAAVYLIDGHLVWCLLVLSVIVISAVILQSFSWSWYKDDENNPSLSPHNRGCASGGSWFCVLHVFQLGVLLRFVKALDYGYKAAFKKGGTDLIAIYSVTDLSMLRLFEAFLEAAPQLVLQVFILLMSDDREYIQYVSVILSCMSISWATLDYYAALKKSLPDQRKLTCGFPYLMYFLYKLLTLNARILLITLLAMINIIAMIGYLCVLWLIMIIYVFVQKTKFCTSMIQEVIYKAVVAIILVFTFFNIKDKNTRIVMIIYYTIRIIETGGVLVFCWFLKGFMVDKSYSLPVSITIGLSLILGIICLVLYYSFCHPKRANDKDFNHCDNAVQFPTSYDEVDGCPSENPTVILKDINKNGIMIDSEVTKPAIISGRITHCLSF
ncbi:XK-related protein 9 [Pristis pectinata]|uniref:XK-related protein 9 n=1 Tax=Pristis pectinata TaxID=685728 RepID=UPI00223D1254|nr:XK-related protein 9 [Pristis pectinata]XP_051879355.1 XK-related protein 9 [Pristis pectinata]